MNRGLSLYLDFVRFSAALAVFITHVSFTPLTDHIVWWPLSDYGDVAVVIFFVLSGFVIAHVTATREVSARAYFAARGARLYSVVLVALLLTFAFDTLGRAINPAFYSLQHVLSKEPSVAGYAASALFLNEFQVFGFDTLVPGSNRPYWSLSFEAAYYVIAGLILFCRPAFAVPLALVILGMAGRSIAALLPLWTLGFFLYRARWEPSWAVASAVAVLSGLAILAVPIVTAQLRQENFGLSFLWGRWASNRNLTADYFVAAAFGLHLLAMRRCLPNWKEIGVVRWLGSLTFPLYCIHYPALCLFAAISPWPKSSVAHLGFVSILTLLIVVSVAPICDFIKPKLRDIFGGVRERPKPAAAVPPGLS